MRPQIVLAVACTLVACTSWIPPEVIGPFAHSLSGHDIEEIRAIVRDRPEVRKPIDYIHVLTPGVVRIQTEDADITARKRNHHWQIDGLQQLRIVTTS